MPIYRLQGADGTIYRVEAPEGTPEDQLVGTVKRQIKLQEIADLRRQAEELKNYKEPPKTTFGGNVGEFFKGLAPGAIGLAETAGAGIASVLPEETEKAAREKIKEIAGIAKKPFEAAPGYEESTSRKLGEALGSTLPFFAAAPFGIPGLIAAGGVGVAAGAGEARMGAEAKGATGEERALATALGIGPGLLDVVAPELKIAGGVIKRALIKGGVEGATEAAQKVSQNLIAKGVYDPSQPLFQGSAEEGAYGAGAGALASFLVDMIAGRRAHTTTTPPPTEQKPQEGIAGLLTDQGVFKPVVFPDGSVAMTPQDVKAHEDALLQKKYTPQMAGAPTEKGQQGDLFPAETRDALTQMSQIQGPQQEFQLTPPEPTAPAEPAQQAPQAPQPQQLELPLERAPVQRDMIAEDEEKQLQEMQRAEQIGAKNEAEVTRVQEQAATRDQTKAEADKAIAETDRLKFESDLAELDAHLKEKQEKTTEQTRIGLLTDIAANNPTANIKVEFDKALRNAGYTDLKFTPREQALIQKIEDFRAAKPEEPEVEPSAPAELGAMEAAIPEKKAREPQQLGFPGMGKPKGAAPAPAPIPATPEQAPITPEQAAQPAQQGEMFGPRGGVLPSAIPPKQPKPATGAVQNVPVTGTQPAAVGVSPEGGVERAAKQPRAKPAGGTGGAKSSGATGLGGRAQPATTSEPAEANKPATVKETAVEIPPVSEKPVEKPVKKKVEKKAETKPAETKPAETKPAETKPASTKIAKNNARAAWHRFEETPYESLSPETQQVWEASHASGEADSKLAGKLMELEYRHGAFKDAFNDTFEEDVGGDDYFLPEVMSLGGTVSPTVQEHIKANDVKSALTQLSKDFKGTMSRVAAKLAANIGNTKVEIAKNIKDENGKPVAGYYDPKTNTIYLDAERGMNPHTLLHEATHAATSHVLSNKSHPVTKQLTALYNSVKNQLDTAYGATSLDEFVAESFSNPDFQAKLAGITLQGGKISGWKKFTNTITNFVRNLIGMNSKPVESAQDRASKLIESILSPAPETSVGNVLYAVAASGDGGKFLDRLGRVAARRSDLTQSRIDEIASWWDTATDFGKDTVLEVLPLQPLVEVAEKKLPIFRQVRTLLKEMEGAVGRRNNRIEITQKFVNDWAGKNQDLIPTLNDVVYESTLERVDPSEPEATYAKDKEKLETWRRLQTNWKLLGAEGQKVYASMRDTYESIYKEIERVLEERLKTDLADEKTADKVKRDIWNKLFAASGKISPYFPLTREGRYWLSYSAPNPETNTTELYVEAFESRRERNRVKEMLDKEGIKWEEFAQAPKNYYKNAPPSSFVNSVVRVLDKNNVSDSAKEEVMTLFMNLLPETSFAQSLRRRQDRMGFKRDAIGAFNAKPFSISRQLNNIEYGAKFGRLKNKIADEIKEKGSTEELVRFQKEFEARIDFITNPNIHWAAKLAKSIGFNMTLGFNVSSAVIQTSQIPLIVQPMLGGEYGEIKAAQAIGYATTKFFGSGTKRNAVGITGETKQMPAAFSLDNIDFAKKDLPDDIKDFEPLVALGRKYGMFNRSLTYDILDVGDKSVLSKVNAISGYAFHQVERMNREVTMAAAYKLEIDRLREDNKGKPLSREQMDKAAEMAIDTTDRLNGGSSLAAAPRIAQGSLRSVLFMFKSYGVSMYYLLGKTTRDALVGESQKVKDAARKQLAGVYTSSALLAGAQGVPMFGVVAMLANLFRDDDEPRFEEDAQRWMGDFYYNGPLQAALGMDISSRIGLSDLIFRDNYTPTQQSMLTNMMTVMGGPVFGIASKVERGLNLIGDGETERGVEQMLPSALGNGFKAVRYYTEGANTLRGDPIIDDLSGASVIGQAFGFAPSDYTRQLEENAMLKRINKTAITERTKLLKKYYVAMRNGDSEEVANVMKDMIEFGKKHPGVYISAKTINSSIKQHMKTTTEMYHGVLLNKNMRSELMMYARPIDESAMDDAESLDEDLE